MTRPKNTVIVHVKTGKTRLRDYLNWIRVKLLPECLWGYSKQTLRDTLLECPRFAELRKKI